MSRRLNIGTARDTHFDIMVIPINKTVSVHRESSSYYTINLQTMKVETIKSYDFPYILEAQKILAANPARQLTITALALEVGINSFKLRVGFKQLFKRTIHQYRLDLRLDLAKQLLTETDLTISEIAHKTGFESRDGFARCFRRKISESPREWRKGMNHILHVSFN
jgi:transcriptional regulator GlxA family with amidase domain